MPDTNEQLPAYMRDSQPAPPTQQPAPSAPAQPTQGQPALPAYMQATTGADTQTDAEELDKILKNNPICLLYTSPSPRDRTRSRMPSSA